MNQNADLLTLRSVSKSYGTVPVLHDIDLSIKDRSEERRVGKEC